MKDNKKKYGIFQQGDIEHIRAHPGMYMGDCNNPWQALKEPLDNAVDEFISGHVSTIYIKYDKKAHEFIVCDNGRGIPVERHSQLKISTLIAVFSKQRTGGKFIREGGLYNTSIGTHGTGSKGTNALSKEFEVWTHQKGKWWNILFKDGEATTKVPSKVSKPLIREEPFNKKGTQVRVKPDKEFFETLDIDVETLQERCSDIAYLCPGLEVRLAIGGKTKIYKSKSGLQDLVDGLIKVESQTLDLKKLHKEAFKLDSTGKDGTGVECVLQWTNGDEEQTYSYVNVSDTQEHGLHYDGLCDAVSEVIGKYAKKSHDFDPEDVRVGLYGAIHLKHKDPHFKSQIKDKLIKPKDVKHDVFSALIDPLKKFFRKNKDLVEDIIEKACELKKARTSYKDKKRALKGLELKKGARGLLPGKLMSAPWCKPHERELFIVEGDSAKGSCGSARDAHFQEILPLKGKIVNSMKKDIAIVLENTEVQSIIQAIGAGIKDECNPEKSRVGKILLLCFTGDTRVTLADGRIFTMRQLARKFGTTKPFPVFAKASDGKTVIAMAYNARKTREGKEVAIVTLENGKKIRCTPDHLFMVNDPKPGDKRVEWIYGLPYIQAQYLMTEDDLVEHDMSEDVSLYVPTISDGGHITWTKSRLRKSMRSQREDMASK